MPTSSITSTWKSQSLWRDYTSSASSWKNNGAPSSYSVVSASITKPATVYRPKPLTLKFAGTARTVTSYKLDDTTGTMTYKVYPNEFMYMNYPVSYLYTTDKIVLPPADLDPRTAMYNQIRLRVKGQAVNLAVALAEYQQTAQLFHDLAKVISSRGKGLLKGFTKSKTASRRFLAFQYGVRPLCGDMAQALKDLHDAANVQPPQVIGVVTRKSTSYKTGLINSSSSVIPEKASYGVTVNRKYRTRYKAVFNPTYIKSALVAHGFANPLATAWEIIPYSFVIDWWINVGDMLSSLDNLLTIDQLLVVDSTVVSTVANVNAHGKQMDGSYTYETLSVTRGSPTVISSVVSLSYKPSKSLQHIANGTALLRSAKLR